MKKAIIVCLAFTIAGGVAQSVRGIIRLPVYPLPAADTKSFTTRRWPAALLCSSPVGAHIHDGIIP